MSNQTLESYVVERVKSLEYEISVLNDEISVLKDEKQQLINKLRSIDALKIKMREYFILGKYASGNYYIDHSYDNSFVNEIVEFIGLKEEEEDTDENS